MPFIESDHLKYFIFDQLNCDGLIHGVFTRRGGVSPKPWASLNLGGTVGDERTNVIENRRRIFNIMERPVESIYDSWQVHGVEVICANEPRPLNSPHQKADIILTNRPNVTLFMRFADCVPILIFDPIRKVIGLVHAGWKGTLAGVAAHAVDKMVSQYQCNSNDLLVGIGPSICVDHYAVGEEVVFSTRQKFGDNSKDVLFQNRGRYHLDLSKANHLILENSGVKKIEQSNLCTYCHNDDWYSHRAENGVTGRFGILFGIK